MIDRFVKKSPIFVEYISYTNTLNLGHKTTLWAISGLGRCLISHFFVSCDNRLFQNPREDPTFFQYFSNYAQKTRFCVIFLNFSVEFILMV